jgi:urea transport system substrate-binding protein
MRRYGFIIVLLIIALLAGSVFVISQSSQLPPIKVGVLHSLSGAMSISEVAVKDATLLAINEINARGGLLGRQIEPIILDGASDSLTFARLAERLIVQEQVDVVFGCWTSSCRKTVIRVFEQYNHLLFYPVQYEGLETSPNVVYTGAAPNQQIIPAVQWSMDNLGTRFFLVGSDYVFPHTANAIITDQLTALRGSIAGEMYLPLGSTDVSEVIEQIQLTRPTVILNTINGDTNVAFFSALREAGITSDQIPVMSFSIGENELTSMELADVMGDYAAWNYFQSIETPENSEFIERYQTAYGRDKVTSDPIEAAYIGVYLWAQAVQEAGTPDVNRVRDTVLDQGYNAPSGVVYVDALTRHTWKTVRIGRINLAGQFDIVWSSENPVRPVPYPSSRTRNEWRDFLQGIYTSWGNSWVNNTGN